MTAKKTDLDTSLKLSGNLKNTHSKSSHLGTLEISYEMQSDDELLNRINNLIKKKLSNQSQKSDSDLFGK